MNLHRLVLVSILILSLLSGCTGAHFDITREIGLLPPRIEDRSDFYDAAEGRCNKYHNNVASPECIQYWQAVLWAQDYRSYVRARAILNRDIIYLGGVVALASVGALAGFSALGHTGSDAYKIIPIAGTFIAGLLGYSKNEALYEAYEVAGTKIDQALRAAEDKTALNTPTAYGEAAAALRRDVGSAIDALTQKKIEIVKFQSKSEAEQFKATHDAAAERELGLFRVTAVSTDAPSDPTKIIATLNSAPDPQKVPTGELRLNLIETAGRGTFALRVSSVTGADVTADLPKELLNHGPRTYSVELQARNGEYSIRDSKSVTLKFNKVRLDIKVNGTGSVSYVDADKKPVKCSPTCDTGLVSINAATNLTATPPAAGPPTYTWTTAPVNCVANTSPCPVTPSDDIKVEVTFP